MYVSGDIAKNAGEIDEKALRRIGYGLYVVTSNDGERDNGMICNTVMQLTDSPCRVAVCMNKGTYSHGVIRESGVMTVNCLTERAPFSLFERFGFASGRDVDKLQNLTPLRAENGLAVLPEYVNAWFSLRVAQYADVGTHGLFICTVSEAAVVSDEATVTYDYYHQSIKPKSEEGRKEGFVCRICGWVLEGDVLPEDIVCPICKHGAADFEPISSSLVHK